jgi:5'(3')-deoxyribonucleotidase
VVVPSLKVITIDLNVLLVHYLSETIDVLNLFLDNILVAITDNSDKEIQEYNQEDDDVENIEDQPDDTDHEL